MMIHRRLTPSPLIPGSLLTALGLAALLAASPVFARAPDLSPPIVGHSLTMTIVPELADAASDGKEMVWTRVVEIPSAGFLKVHFADFALRPGDSLTLRSRTGRVIEELRGRGPKDLESFWGLSGQGQQLTLELRFQEPYETAPFLIDKVMVGDSEIFDAPLGGDDHESICAPAQFEDVLCYDSDPGKWATIFASIGVMTAGGNVSLFCSGTNLRGNRVLTNDHCVSSQASCNNTEFVFRYYRTGCNDGSPPTADWVAFRCDELLANSPAGPCDPTLSALDFSLFSVVGDPEATFGSVDPDPTPLTDSEQIYIVQHPSGRPHEITHGSGGNVDVDGTTLRYYDTLDTEGGSSGSPIFRESDNRMVGLHHCGGCSTPGVGNRGMMMSDIYPLIEPFLPSDGDLFFSDDFEGGHPPTQWSTAVGATP